MTVESAGLQAVVDEVVTSSPLITWSICVRDADGRVRAQSGADDLLGTASLGKVFLLVEVARRIEADPALADRLLLRADAPSVAEAGLWQHLRVPGLPMADVAVLTASVSDNLATNVLLEAVGLDSVTAVTEALKLERSRLLDRVRRERTDDDPPHLSVGTAAELSELMRRVHRGEVLSPAVSRTLALWLSLNADLSLVAGAFGLDPLAHTLGSGPLRLVNKTGSDRGVKADAGVVAADGGALAYAVLANWSQDDAELAARVVLGMHALGTAIVSTLGP